MDEYIRLCTRAKQYRSEMRGFFAHFAYTVRTFLVVVISELDRLGAQIFLNHQGNLEGDRVLKFTQIESRQLANFFQAVNQRVSVYKQLS